MGRVGTEITWSQLLYTGIFYLVPITSGMAVAHGTYAMIRRVRGSLSHPA